MPSPEDAATLNAYLTGVDEAARRAEAKWGMGRLPRLVDDELRAKFLRQQNRWSEAMRVAWEADVLTRGQLDTVIASSGAMQRAWAALDAAAEAAGAKPLPPDVWETTRQDGSVVAVVRTHADASLVLAEGRHLAVYALEEVASIIDALPPAITAAKREFPGAKIQPPRDRSWARSGDPIPF